MSHLATVVGSYLGVFGILLALTGTPWVFWSIAAVYLATLAFNVPWRVLAACAVFVAAFFAILQALPPIPNWLGLVLIVLSHQVQNWSHKLWNKEYDMSAFAAKYPKGLKHFVLLSLYELPILLNYLIFDRKNWTA